MEEIDTTALRQMIERAIEECTDVELLDLILKLLIIQ